MVAKEQVSAACGAINSLAYSLLEASLTTEETTRDLPAWMLATGHDAADGIHWASAPAAQLARNVARIAQQQVVHAGDVPKPPATKIDHTEFADAESHLVPENACTLQGIQKNGEGRKSPVAFESIPGEDPEVLLARLTEPGVALSQGNRGKIAIINLNLMLDLYARNENQATMSGRISDRKDWLKINAALSAYPMEHLEVMGDEHIHFLSNPQEVKERQLPTETGLYQVVLLTSEGLEVIYEAWVDYSEMDRLPKRVAGLIFIVGLMSSGVGVMMSRKALLKEAGISEELRRQSRTDSLTGLPNRRAWDEALNRENHLRRRHERAYAIAVVDLDDFKLINDRFGHASGDSRLRQTAKILKSVIRGEDIAARVGGDEFAVLFCDICGDSADALLSRLNASFEGDGVDVSIGIAFVQSGSSLEECWKQADLKMYSFKDSKRKKEA